MTDTRHGYRAPYDGVHQHDGPRDQCTNPGCQTPELALGTHVTVTLGQPYELTWNEEPCPHEGKTGILVEVDHDMTNRDFYAPYCVALGDRRVWVGEVEETAARRCVLHGSSCDGDMTQPHIMQPVEDCTPEETGERENSLAYYLGPRTAPQRPAGLDRLLDHVAANLPDEDEADEKPEPMPLLVGEQVAAYGTACQASALRYAADHIDAASSISAAVHATAELRSMANEIATAPTPDLTPATARYGDVLPPSGDDPRTAIVGTLDNGHPVAILLDPAQVPGVADDLYDAHHVNAPLEITGSDRIAEDRGAALDRVRALHTRDDDANYCTVCANHGDITWPCATIAAVDGVQQTEGAQAEQPGACPDCGDEPSKWCTGCAACSCADYHDPGCPQAEAVDTESEARQ